MFIAIFASAWDKLALVNTGTSRTARRLSRGLTAIAVALFMSPAALAAGGGHDTGGDDPLLPVVAVLIAVALEVCGELVHLRRQLLGLLRLRRADLVATPRERRTVRFSPASASSSRAFSAS